jgi:hypothetical protein
MVLPEVPFSSNYLDPDLGVGYLYDMQSSIHEFRFIFCFHLVFLQLYLNVLLTSLEVFHEKVPVLILFNSVVELE